MTKVLIVLSSVRKGRTANKILATTQEALKKFPNLEVTVADFSETPLPFFDNAASPSAEDFTADDANVQEWTKQVQEADKVVILTAEYNHTFTAVIKNAVDWIPGSIWQDKPVAFIGYGWVGGTRAITQLRGLLTGFLKADLLETEANLYFTKDIELDGTPIGTDASEAIEAVLAKL